MANIGDSITAGSLADTNAGEARTNWFLQQVKASRAEGKHTKRDILDDLIDYNKNTLAWGSGLQIDSHYKLLQEHYVRHESVGLDIQNEAMPGNTAKEAVGQAQRIVNSMKSGKYRQLAYVTFMMGSNDACYSISDAATAKYLRLALLKLAEVKQERPIRVLVSGLPRIPDIGKKSIMDHPVFGVSSCRLIQLVMLQFCNPLLDWQTPEQYQSRLAVVQTKNKLIEKVVNQVRAEAPNLDIVFTNYFYNNPIEYGDLAIDCFHPNLKSHKKLARDLWAEQPWFDAGRPIAP